VPKAAHGAAGSPEESEDEAYDEDDDADRPEDGDREEKPMTSRAMPRMTTVIS
jgi:hypothetical protein